jgi:hypothetical protein
MRQGDLTVRRRRVACQPWWMAAAATSPWTTMMKPDETPRWSIRRAPHSPAPTILPRTLVIPSPGPWFITAGRRCLSIVALSLSLLFSSCSSKTFSAYGNGEDSWFSVVGTRSSIWWPTGCVDSHICILGKGARLVERKARSVWSW